jgi:hypothetical protein
MFSDMNDFIKEVETEVNFEDLVNRIYSADIKEDVRTSLVEKAFVSKEYLDKHSTAIHSLITKSDQYHYNVARKTIMDLHHLKELDPKPHQDVHTKVNENVSHSTKPKDTGKDTAQNPPEKKPKPKPKDDSYSSLGDIPDERYDPPPPPQKNQRQPVNQAHEITPPKRETYDAHAGSKAC